MPVKKKDKSQETENLKTAVAEESAELEISKESFQEVEDLLKSEGISLITEEDELFLKQTAKTVEAAAALTEPVVFFYTVGVDSKDKVVFIKSRLMLNDKFLGKMIPEHYVSCAETASRIEELNLVEVEEVASKCNELKDYLFVTTVSVRNLLKAEATKKLIKIGATENKNLMLSFDAPTLAVVGELGIKGIKELKEAGFKIMLENLENAPIKVLSQYDINFARLDFRFYKQRTADQFAQAQAVISLCKSRGISVSCAYIKHLGEAQYMLNQGADTAEGYAFGEPKRSALSAVEERRYLTAIK
ncbi:MAG: EAL domain-containing protein [Firmicutes bacterium]|nr:EAL domain-containing protein [Bacillota bacterium]